MLPNFLIIGAQKAATTWLARSLEQHQDVFMVPEKETHFFNHRFERGSEWYESRFNSWSTEVAIGEATPGYMSHPEAPGRILSVLGDEVKLIAILRHPVDRAYSAFWHYTTRGKIPPGTDFKTFLQTDDGFELRNRSYYFTHLNRYLQYFAKDTLLTLIYEEMKQDNKKTINHCLGYLDIDTDYVSQTTKSKTNQSKDVKRFQSQAVKLRRAIAAKTRLLPEGVKEPLLKAGSYAFQQFMFKWLPKKDDYQPLDQQVQIELLEHFMSEITQLEHLLERDFSVWYETSSAKISM